MNNLHRLPRPNTTRKVLVQGSQAEMLKGALDTFKERNSKLQDDANKKSEEFRGAVVKEAAKIVGVDASAIHGIDESNVDLGILVVHVLEEEDTPEESKEAV